MRIPFLSFTKVNQQIKKEITETFENFFDASWYILGEKLKEFETAYARLNNVKHCIGVSNGLDALFLSLKALGIKEGDEVIIPSNTYIATALAVSYVGAQPVFAEPDITTSNISAINIEKAITKKTKAIIPVHLYGQACEMEAIMQIAKQNNLFVIEDNAQSHGAIYDDRLTGSWGNINATSFYPGKNLGAFGDAGAITTDDDALAEKVMMLRNYGSRKKYYNEVIGYNKRLDECQAAFLSVKLKYLDEWTKQRQQIADWYGKYLNNVGDVILPRIAKKSSHVFHLFIIKTKFRNELQAHLKENGIGTLIHYPVPIHLQKAYAHLKYKKGDFPIAEELADTCLSLPLWPGMNETDVINVTETIKEFFND